MPMPKWTFPEWFLILVFGSLGGALLSLLTAIGLDLL